MKRRAAAASHAPPPKKRMLVDIDTSDSAPLISIPQVTEPYSPISDSATNVHHFVPSNSLDRPQTSINQELISFKSASNFGSENHSEHSVYSDSNITLQSDFLTQQERQILPNRRNYPLMTTEILPGHYDPDNPSKFTVCWAQLYRSPYWPAKV